MIPPKNDYFDESDTVAMISTMVWLPIVYLDPAMRTIIGCQIGPLVTNTAFVFVSKRTVVRMFNPPPSLLYYKSSASRAMIHAHTTCRILRISAIWTILFDLEIHHGNHVFDGFAKRNR